MQRQLLLMPIYIIFAGVIICYIFLKHCFSVMFANGGDKIALCPEIIEDAPNFGPCMDRAPMARDF